MKEEIGEHQPFEFKRNLIVSVCLLLLLVLAGSFLFERTADLPADNEIEIEKGLFAGHAGAPDDVESLGKTPNPKEAIFWAFTEGGEAVIFNRELKETARAENPPTDPNSELPASVTAFGYLGDGKFLGGTGNGRINVYQQTAEGKLVLLSMIGEFRNLELRDPIASSGSVSHIFINARKSRAVVLNYDGLGYLYAISEEKIEILKSFQLSAGLVGGGFTSEMQVWLVTYDGRAIVYNLDDMERPVLVFDATDYGRIRGADYRNGLFLIYGHSLDVKTASVALYDQNGNLKVILKKNEQNLDNFQPSHNMNAPLSEFPTVADLGESFDDVKFVGDGVAAAVKDTALFLLDFERNKSEKIVLPLKPGERLRRFIWLDRKTYIFATSIGRVFEQQINR